MGPSVIDTDNDGFAVTAVCDFDVTIELDTPNGAGHVLVIENLIVGCMLVDTGRMFGIPRRRTCFDKAGARGGGYFMWVRTMSQPDQKCQNQN